MDNVPIEYTPNWVRPEAADECFIRLWDELEWVRHPGVPRREYYVHADNKPYSYGLAAYARTYEPQFMHDTILRLWMMAESHLQCAFETCFLNGYEDGKDFLGWHADDSPEMDDARPILIVTFGAEREIWFRKNGAGPGERVAQRLGHGSLCVMKPGMQDTHQHRIPKGDREYGPRISLTFRGYVWQPE